MQKFTWSGFGLRFLFALVLVLATYNPTGYSYAHWFGNLFPSITAAVALCGIVLTIGWVVYVRATLRSLGPIGLGLTGALFGCLIWLFIDLGWLSLKNISVITWLILLVLAAILALGMSWSHVRRRLSGQVDTDDLDDN